jgi:hypothetical protein
VKGRGGRLEANGKVEVEVKVEEGQVLLCCGSPEGQAEVKVKVERGRGKGGG